VSVPLFQPFSVTLLPGPRRQPARGFVSGNPGLVPSIPVGLHGVTGTPRTVTVTSVRGNDRLRLLAVREPGGRVLVITTSLSKVNKTVGQLELILAIGSAVAGLLAAGGVAWIMRRGLRPIESMAGQADEITAGDLTDRVTAHDPRTEVGRLSAAINGMLARIEDFMAECEASQEATRQFFADASHELRTPLASLRANAELYQQGALPERPQVHEAMRRITLESQRMSGLVDDMLRLARLDQHPDQEHEPATSPPSSPNAPSGRRSAIPGGPGTLISPTAWRPRATRNCCAGRSTTSSPTCTPTPPTAPSPPSPPPGATAPSRSRSATTAPASLPGSSPASSSASTAPEPRHTAPAPASAWPS
jgi:HAMP domain-containing protein